MELHLPLELEGKLAAAASRRGVTVEALAQTLTSTGKLSVKLMARRARYELRLDSTVASQELACRVGVPPSHPPTAWPKVISR